MYVLVKGNKLHYSLQGKGKTIVLLHGFMESLNLWKYFTRRLSSGFRVLSIDLPGHGLSENIRKVHSMELMADTVNAVLKELGIASCHMVGHSMGGYVSLAFAERYPRKLKGLTLFHSHAMADSAEARKNRDRAIKLVSQDKIGYVQNFFPLLFAEQNIPL